MSTHDDTPRELQAAILYGTVESVDTAAATCRVRSGDILTDAVPWMAQRAGATRRWSPPTAGEQVVLLCPGGDTHGAVALLGLYTSGAAPSTSAHEDVTEYPDGTRISYDHAAKKLTAFLASPGEIDISAAKVKITADVMIVGKVLIDGDADCTGTLKGDIDVIAAGVSGKGHAHPGVQRGGALTDPPASA